MIYYYKIDYRIYTDSRNELMVMSSLSRSEIEKKLAEAKERRCFDFFETVSVDGGTIPYKEWVEKNGCPQTLYTPEDWEAFSLDEYYPVYCESTEGYIDLLNWFAGTDFTLLIPNGYFGVNPGLYQSSVE